MKIGTVLLLLVGMIGGGESFGWGSVGPETTDADLGQAIGFYSNGSLRNATPLVAESQDHSVLFRPRNRSWGTQGLVELLQKISGDLHREFPSGERLQIGDLSQKTGGAAVGHASHQNGLDVDVAYLRVDRREQDPRITTGFDESFVTQGKLTSNFDLERNWRLIQLLVASGRVERMFVDPAIKLAFCKRAERSCDGSRETEEILRRLRPWPNHDNHIHVRISCPAFSPKCESQEPPAAGSGCQELT